MANLILGLLMIRELTIYDIKNTFEKKITPFFSASFGAIQAAIKKLLALGYIEAHAAVENGRNKVKYHLTDTGKAAFFDWMRQSFTVSKFNSDALIRVFFFGFIAQEERISLLNEYLQKLKREYEDVLAFARDVRASADFGHLQKIVDFQLVSLDYGIQQLAFEIKWYEALLQQLKEGKFNE